MHLKRIFTAINLPEEIKTQITQIIQSVKSGDISENQWRWLAPENWHLTITFLGYQPDSVIPLISQSIKSTVKNYSDILQNIRIVFKKIIFAPPGKTPRMIWFMDDKRSSETLGRIKGALEDELVKNGVKFQRENRPYNAHLTLARFHSKAQNYAEILHKSPFSRGSTSPILTSISEEVESHKIENIAFYPQSLDLMQSRLKHTGAEYEILERFDFNQ